METKIIKRMVIILSIFSVVIIAALIGNSIANRDYTPTVSNPDDIFMEFNGVTVTHGELYERMRTMDGLDHLIDFIDRQLLADEMTAVTNDEIDEEILRLKYGTADQDEIDLFTDEELDQYEQAFRDRIVQNGYNPNDSDSVDAFVRLRVAKLNYVTNLYMSANEGSPYYVAQSALKEFYEDNYKGSVNAIGIRFNSATEYRNTMRHFSLVSNYDGGIGLYSGEEPIGDVARDDFDEDNTRKLTEEEVLEYYILMYNYIYPYREALPEASTVEDLLALDNDFFVYDFVEYQASSNLRSISTYLFKTLAEQDIEYARDSTTVGEFRLLFYVLDRQEADDFDDLDFDFLVDLRERFIEEKRLTSANIDTEVRKLREANDLVLHDRLLALNYEMTSGSRLFERDSSREYIISINGVGITTDEFYNTMRNRIGALYAVEVAKQNYLIQSDYFEDVYGTDRRFMGRNRNSSEVFRIHERIVNQESTLFGNGQYAQQGFSPQAMTFDEFLFIGYGFAGREDFKVNLIINYLRSDFLDDRFDFSEIEKYIEYQAENYFSLLVSHILIHVDMNEDFNPDNFDDYLEGLDEDDTAAFNALKGRLENLILDELEDNSMREIVDAFRHAPRGEDEDASDYSVWAEFKNAGLLLKYEDLSPMNQQTGQRTALTFTTTKDRLHENFVDALIELYASYSSDENKDLDAYIADQLTTTSFGMHLIRATKPTGVQTPFTRPSAESDVEGIENTSYIPTEAQVLIYNAIKHAERRGETPEQTLPADVTRALDSFYGPTYNRVFGASNFTLEMIDAMQESNLTFTENDAKFKADIDMILELFMRATFPDID